MKVYIIKVINSTYLGTALENYVYKNCKDAFKRVFSELVYSNIISTYGNILFKDYGYCDNGKDYNQLLEDEELMESFIKAYYEAVKEGAIELYLESDGSIEILSIEEVIE